MRLWDGNTLSAEETALFRRQAYWQVDIQVELDKSSAWRPKEDDSPRFDEDSGIGQRLGRRQFQIRREELPAHLNILQVRVPQLAALAKDYPPHTPIPIQDIKPAFTFRSLLHFVYSDDVPKSEGLKNEARDHFLNNIYVSKHVCIYPARRVKGVHPLFGRDYKIANHIFTALAKVSVRSPHHKHMPEQSIV
jgi:hypothetical protein